MCNLTYRSPRETVSLSFQSFDLLPAPPCCERLTSDETTQAVLRNLQELCLPFDFPTNKPREEEGDEAEIKSTTAPQPNKKLSSVCLLRIEPASNKRLVRRALHRMASRPDSVNSRRHSSFDGEQQVSPTEADEERQQQQVLVERMSRLMQNSHTSSSSNQKGGVTNTKAGERRESPVALIRGVSRTSSGAALCA